MTVLIFVTLGIAVSLFRSLVLALEIGQPLPLFDPEAAIIRIVLAILLWLATVVFLRPGRRNFWEFTLYFILTLPLLAIAVWVDRPAVALFVMPVLVRYWSSRKVALTYFIILAVVGNVWSGFLSHTLDSWGQTVDEKIRLAVLTFAEASFAYIAFELALKLEEERRRLAEVLQQLEYYQQNALRYAGLQERARLSQDLHDSLGHHLTILRLDTQHLQKLTMQASFNRESIVESVNDVEDRCREAFVNLQDVVSVLSRSRFDESFFKSLSLLARSNSYLVNMSFVGNEPQLNYEIQMAIYRCLQESITNALKYGDGEGIRVIVYAEKDYLEVQVINRFLVGLSRALENSWNSNNSGLKGMHQRMQTLGGYVTYTSEKGIFQVKIFLPIQRI